MLLLTLDLVLDWLISPEACLTNFCEVKPADGVAEVAWILEDAGAAI